MASHSHRHRKVSKHEQEMKDLSDVLYAMELKYNERETEAQQEYQSIMDELKNKVDGKLSVWSELSEYQISHSDTFHGILV